MPGMSSDPWGGSPGGLGGGSTGAGFSGVTDTGAGYTGDAPAVGIQPGGVTPQGTSDVGQANALQNAHAGMSWMQQFANSLGDSPDERRKNARAFADIVEQMGKLGQQFNDTTIMQRLMQGRIRPIAQLSTGQSSGGVGALPSTIPPDVAQGIMSRMGYKG